MARYNEPFNNYRLLCSENGAPALCMICQEQPAFADTGVCRWESCEREALERSDTSDSE